MKDYQRAHIHDNYIGTDQGYRFMPVTVGIELYDHSAFACRDNLIEDNGICATDYCIDIIGHMYAGNHNNVFRGNYTGLLSNSINALRMQGPCSGTKVIENYFAGASSDGIYLNGCVDDIGIADDEGVYIFGNAIGVGGIPMNGGYGINAEGTQFLVIEGNIIGDNTLGGIRVYQTEFYIADNLIGTTEGSSAYYGIRRNYRPGIVVENCNESPANIRENNRIAFNDGNGISIINSSGVSVNWNNEIFANEGSGILLQNSSNCIINNNLIGNNTRFPDFGNYGNIGNGIHITDGSASNAIGPNNIIVCSGGNGVRIESSASVNNKIRGNLIYGNSGLGIDLGGDGVTANDDPDDPRIDPDIGPNDLFNYPIVQSISTGSNTNVRNIHGLAGANCDIDLFITGGYYNGSGHGDAYQFHGEASSDATGNFTVTDIPLGSIVTLTATGNLGEGSTSEFSANCPVMPERWVTTNIDDLTTPGTLRAALIEANASAGPDLIRFLDLPGPIILTAELPALSDITGGTIIDARNDQCDVPRATIDGRNLGSGNGFTLASSGNEIWGMAIVNFPINGIEIQSSGANNKVNDNYIGINIDGSDGGNGCNGIYVAGANNQIGTTCENVISNNGCAGIWGIGSNGLIVSNNKIGTNVAGTAIKSNTGAGVEIRFCNDITLNANTISGNGSSNVFAISVTELEINANYIGTNSSGTGSLGTGVTGLVLNTIDGAVLNSNLISGNDDGVTCLISQNITLTKNKIGTDITGSFSVPNYSRGISIVDCVDIQIGSETESDGNIIANNQVGIEARGSGHLIACNLITKNSAGGILLGEGTNNNQIISNKIIGNNYNLRIYRSGTLPSAQNLISKNIVYDCQDGPDIDLYPWGISPLITGWDDDGSPNNKRTPPVLHINSQNNTIIAQFSTGEFPINGRVEFYLTRGYDASVNDTLDGSFVFVDTLQSYLRNATLSTYHNGGAIAYLGAVNCSNVPQDIVVNLSDLEAVLSGDVQIQTGYVITALAVDESNNTSEFSNNVIVSDLSVPGYCPILLEMEDPTGYLINSSLSEIPGASYDSTLDFNHDGDLDEQILIRGVIAGDYKIRVYPAPDATPGSTYSLLAIMGTETTSIVINATVPVGGTYDEYTYATRYSPTTCCNLAGDANDNSVVNILDVTYILAYRFKSGPPPPCLQEADANGNGIINILDATYIIAYRFKGGPAPVCGP